MTNYGSFYHYKGQVGIAHSTSGLHKNKGITVIELLVAVLVIGCLAAIVAGVYWKFFQQPQETEAARNAAIQNLNNFSKTAVLKPIDCVSQDPENDGYVDCTAQDQKGQFINLECAYKRENQGCKVNKPQ